uniref:ATP synthase complex subunit 8 n=1 Tax=Chascanopsetta lugubris TaxID=1003706 RepID=A0A1N7T5N3_9PLEU|nr:ATP synthase F0 subunit 8 [Chascanopsetta lugubris]AID59775.1 ATP synthase F0 subunit 8 [Chascanopsetta lugubris]BAX03932.1 ATPase subunit 8 [Chascanopsetta lugubris]
MPQLNPAPWLMILVFSWLIFLTVVPIKVTAHITPSHPEPGLTSTSDKAMWTWPWQ